MERILSEKWRAKKIQKERKMDSKTKNRENTLKIRFVWKKTTDFRSRMRLRAFIQLILEEIGKKSSGSVTIVFLGEEDLLRINKEYLNHDYHTDIITFDYECFNQENELLNTGTVTLVFIDKEKNKPMQPPSWFLEAFKKKFNA